MHLGKGVLAFVVILAAPAAAAEAGIEGLWRTHPDNDSDPALIRVWVENGQAFGRVVEIMPKPGHSANPLCEECEGERHAKPVKGMVVMWGLVADDEAWSGGRILDPANGETYSCALRLRDSGRGLEVRGYVGMALFGRTQTWTRAGT